MNEKNDWKEMKQSNFQFSLFGSGFVALIILSGITIDSIGENGPVQCQVDFQVGQTAAGACSTAGANEFTDNRTHTLSVSLSGINWSEVTLVWSSSPTDGSPSSRLNVAGSTSISFSETSQGNWKTSKVYWYGVTPSNTCYTYVPSYDVTVQVKKNGSTVCEKTKTIPVKLLGNGGAQPQWGATVQYGPGEPVPGIANWYRCQVIFNDFTKVGVLNVSDLCNQFGAYGIAEENYHKDQIEEGVPLAQGGTQELFKAEGVKWFIPFTGSGALYYYGTTKAAAEAGAHTALITATQAEANHSSSVWYWNVCYVEKKAKEVTAVPMAYTYECAYPGCPSNPPLYHHVRTGILPTP